MTEIFVIKYLYIQPTIYTYNIFIYDKECEGHTYNFIMSFKMYVYTLASI